MIDSMTQPERRLGRAKGEASAERVGRSAATAPAQIGMAVVFALIGYEWLLSGVNKLLLGPRFASGMSQLLQSGMDAHPGGWFAAFAEQAVLPHAAIFAAIVQISELAVAAGFIIGAVAWARSDCLPAALGRRVDPLVVGALLVSAVMALSYAMLDGDGLPLPNPVNAFGPGFSIDLLLAFAALFLLPVQIAHALVRRRASDDGEDAAQSA